MRRILEMELDSKFFRLGQAALKSFLLHNPGWELYICDIGLTTAQREELSEVALVERGRVWEHGRWPNATARMSGLAKLCEVPDAVILHLDADTLTFGSIDPLIEELQQSDAAIMLAPMQSKLAEWLFSFDKIKEIFERAETWYTHGCYNLGVAAMLSGEPLAGVCKRAGEKYIKYRGVFRCGDQPAMVAELLDSGVSIGDMPMIYNVSPTGDQGVALFNPPILEDGTELVIMHVPFAKELVFSLDAPFYAAGWWWTQWLRRYEEEPWPTSG